MSINTRQYERRDLMVNARLLFADTWHECKITNMSAGGVRLKISGVFDQSERICLEIKEFGHFLGLIAWQQSEEMGVVFAEDPGVMGDVVMGLARCSSV